MRIVKLDLDAGCGDGHFSSLLFGEVRLGLDLSRSALGRAREKRVYENLLNADIAHLPVRDGCMNYVLCNAVIANINDISLGVKELARSLSPKGVLVLSTVINHWKEWFFYSTFLPGFLFGRMRERFVPFINAYLGGIVHILDYDKWVRLLAPLGLDIVEHRYYLSPVSFLLFEIETELDILLTCFLRIPPLIQRPLSLNIKRVFARIIELLGRERITAASGACIMMVLKKASLHSVG